MSGFIPFIILLIVFAAIGLYFALFTRHFLAWTTLSNQKLHKRIDNRLGRPVLETRANLNYARLQANGGLSFFTWSIRTIGIALVVISIINVLRIFGVV
jgi:hypothetical protein